MNVRKYLEVFKVSMAEVFTYRANFIMWRFRQVLVFLIPFFVWTSILSSGGSIYGYNLAAILTYLFGTTLLRSLVLGSRTVDLAAVIQNGDLSIYLLQPINIQAYWFTRDISDKIYNLSFMLVEFPLIIFLFHPPIFLQSNPIIVIQTIILIALAITLYFYINFLFGTIGFWAKEVWAPRFMLMIIMDFATGASIPLDMFPSTWQTLISLTPFPYLIFFPLKTYLGENTRYFLTVAVMLVWIILLRKLASLLWNKGTRNYESEGR